METDSAVRQIPGESAAVEGGGGRDEGALSQDARAAAEARARGKKKRASNVDDADSDTELANTPIRHASERRMASMLDGTLSAEAYDAPEEMRAYQGALRAEAAVEPAGASDNWAQKGLDEAHMLYNEQRALARAKGRAEYVPVKDREYFPARTRGFAIELYGAMEEKQREIEAKPFQEGELASDRAREELAAAERAMAHCVAKKG